MMKRYIHLFLLLLLPLWTFSQVTTTPAFVQQDQPVTIRFNAKEGSGGLTGATKVYMHAGVVTAGPNSTDWKYVKGNWGVDNSVGLMTQVGTDLWEITLPSPRTYFEVPADERIYRMAMVFRNADGSKEGKSASGGDIFVEVYDGLAVNFTKPAASTVLANAGENFTIEATASAPAALSLSINGTPVATAANATQISHTYTFQGAAGKDVIVVTASNGTSTATDELEIIKKTSSPEAAIPAGLKQGFNKTGPNEATFVLSAPGKSSVHLIGDFTNWKQEIDYLMKRDGDLFWITIPNLDPTKEYAYYYLINQSLDVADPYAEKILDKGEDRWIDAIRYPNLRMFPESAATNRLATFMLQESPYNWQATGYTRPEKKDLIIYELLIRDFSSAESVQGVIDRLDYLDALNVTAIQLMPVMEFSGNDSWGYNPTFMTALDKWYGTKNKFKELIDKAHQRGIAVILDITLNHQDYPNPFLKMWWAGSTASAENPMFNPTPTHPFNVFTDMNHESEYTKQYVDQITRYWLEEYKVDGFRFDLSKGFTQKNNPTDVGAWSAYDQSRIDLLKRMADEIWQVDPKAYIILEHFAENSEEKVLADYGMMLWGNLNHAYSEAAKGTNLNSQESDFNWISWKQRGWSQPNVIGYMESHDEERMMYRLLNSGNSSGSYNTRLLPTALERVKMAAALFIPVPGPKMIWQFGELGYDVSIDQNGRTGKKPIKWEYLEDAARQDLLETMSALNALKTSLPVFETDNYVLNASGPVKSLFLDGADMDVQIVGNFDVTEKTVALNMPQQGLWWSYFSGDSIPVNSSQPVITLAPGEFHVLFSQKVVYSKANPTASKLLPTLDLQINGNSPASTDILQLEGRSSITFTATADVNADINLEVNKTAVKNGTGKVLSHSMLLYPDENPYVIVASAYRNNLVVRDTIRVKVNGPTSLQDKTYSASISVAPNPAGENLAVHLDKEPSKTLYFQVLDLSGREVKGFLTIVKQSNSTYLLQLNGLSSGLYLLKIQDGDKTAIKRFIKH